MNVIMSVKKRSNVKQDMNTSALTTENRSVKTCGKTSVMGKMEREEKEVPKATKELVEEDHTG